MTRILVTGAAGFIGFHTASQLLDRGDEVCGLDNLNEYYRIQLKHDRLKQLEGRDGFSFSKISLEDRDSVTKLFAEMKFDKVIHLAAQAGVR
ncbi:MAG: GDP-mannose 4,6-dehydratase, partial [Planctomycetota bacterium]|nr:GDP-mannose 4,6-dehydratase [Planctomycetota bacterium]